MATEVEGGYVLVTVGQFANVCAAKIAGEISFLALRVWLAAHEQRAKRCTASGPVRFTASELAALIGGASEKGVSAALDRLRSLRLLRWDENHIDFQRELLPEASLLASRLGTSPFRPIPVPRFLLRAIFRHKAPSEVMAAIAHLIRCLFRKNKEIFAYGLVKASWVASAFGIGERSVHSARRWLTAGGFLIQEPLNQFVLNRWGGKFVVKLEQKGKRLAHFTKQVRGAQQKRAIESAPPPNKSTYLSTYYNQINNKPAKAVHGVQAAIEEKPTGKPTLNNVTAEDLRKLPRLEELYRQAVQAKWLQHSEANLRNFTSAALRATRAGGRVGAIFVGIVKGGLWHHVTHEQEDRAALVLNRYRERSPWAFQPASEPALEGCVGPEIGELVKLVLNGSEMCAPSMAELGEAVR